MDNSLCTFCLTLAVEPIELKCHHLICHGCSELTDICYYCKSLDKKSRSNSPRFQQPQSTRPSKAIQKSIQFLENQAVYMTQFIEMQISSLIQCLKDRQTQLLAQLNLHITKKINFYQNAAQANIKVEEYNDDKFMDFTNLKILTDEIQKFGKPIKINKQKKENQILHDVKLNKPQKKSIQVKQQKVQFRQQSNMTLQSKQSTYDENTHRMSFDDRSIDYKLSI